MRLKPLCNTLTIDSKIKYKWFRHNLVLYIYAQRFYINIAINIASKMLLIFIVEIWALGDFFAYFSVFSECPTNNMDYSYKLI